MCVRGGAGWVLVEMMSEMLRVSGFRSRERTEDLVLVLGMK